MERLEAFHAQGKLAHITMCIRLSPLAILRAVSASVALLQNHRHVGTLGHLHWVRCRDSTLSLSPNTTSFSNKLFSKLHSKRKQSSGLRAPSFGPQLVVCGLRHDNEGIANAHIHKEEEQVYPPFLAHSKCGILRSDLVRPVHAEHIFIVVLDYRGTWNLNLAAILLSAFDEHIRDRRVISC